MVEVHTVSEIQRLPADVVKYEVHAVLCQFHEQRRHDQCYFIVVFYPKLYTSCGTEKTENLLIVRSIESILHPCRALDGTREELLRSTSYTHTLSSHHRVQTPASQAQHLALVE